MMEVWLLPGRYLHQRVSHTSWYGPALQVHHACKLAALSSIGQSYLLIATRRPSRHARASYASLALA